MRELFTAKMAKQIVITLNPEYTISGCCDMGDYYFFGLAGKNGERLYDAYECISKTTGKRVHVDPFSNIIKFNNAPIIDV